MGSWGLRGGGGLARLAGPVEPVIQGEVPQAPFFLGVEGREALL